MAMLTWEVLCKDWMEAANTSNPTKLLPHLSEDFNWSTSARAKEDGRSEGLYYLDMKDWCLNASNNITEGEYENTIHDGEDILVGTHLVTRNGSRFRVMCAAKMRNGKVYDYHHSMAPL